MKVSPQWVLTLVFIFVFSGTAIGQNYYLNDGGLGTNLIVVRPTGNSLPGEEEFILDYIQNLLISHFKKYTAIKASSSISTSNIEETETAFLLNSVLSKNGNTYSLDLSVTDPNKGLRIATYQNTNVIIHDLLSAQAITAGFLDIAAKLNVNLSEAGISAAANPSRGEIEAAINLARGTVAEKNNNPIEMLTYLYNAFSYDPGLLDAENRFDDLSKMLSSGDVGESVKTDMHAREKWKEILDEFDNFYQAHPPFILSFNPLPSKKGYTDYDNKTAMLEFEMLFQEDVSFGAMQKVFVTVATGLKNTNNQEVWGFITRPYRSPLFGKFRYYTLNAELVNDRDEVVGSSSFRVRSRIAIFRNSLYADTTQKIKQSFSPIHIDNELTGNMLVRIISIDGIETEKAMQDGYVKIVPAETLPQAKTRNPLVLITRYIFE